MLYPKRLVDIDKPIQVQIDSFQSIVRTTNASVVTDDGLDNSLANSSPVSYNSNENRLEQPLLMVRGTSRLGSNKNALEAYLSIIEKSEQG